MVMEWVIDRLEDGVVVGVLMFEGEVLVDRRDRVERDVVGDLKGICSGWSNDLRGWGDEGWFEVVLVLESGMGVEGG